MHAFVCESPVVDRETILERDARGDVTTLLIGVEGDREGYEAALDEVDAVEKWATEAAPTNGRGERFFVYVRTRLRDRERSYHDALDRDGVLVVPPVELRADRTVRLTLVGPADPLRAAVEGLPDRVRVDVLRTGSYRRATGGALTDRQQEAVRLARSVGYYDVPRTGDLAAVAAELDCSTSTASTLLRRAEARLVAAALDE